MTKLQDLRKKYPQYDSISDEELVGAFHSKYYADMPIQEFHSRLGYKSPKQGWSGVGEDVTKSLQKVPENLLEMIKQLPGEAFGAASNPRRIPQNLGAGLAQGGAGLLNTPANIRDYLASKNIVSKESPSLRLPESILPKNFNYAEAVGLSDVKPGDALVQGIGASAPYVASGEIGALGIPARMAARAAAQVPFAIGQNENPITAAAMPFALEGMVRGVPKAANALRPTNLLKGGLSDAELSANLRAAKETNTDIGNIIGSPTLKQIFENITAKAPFSGAEKLLGKMANQVSERAESLLSEAGKGIPAGDRNVILKNTIEDAYQTQSKIKTDLYAPVNELAAKESFNLELPSLEKFSKEFGDSLNDSFLMKNDKTLRTAFNELSKYSKVTGSDSLGTLGPDGLLSKSQVTKAPTILEAKVLAGRLDTEASKHMSSPNPADRFVGGKFSDAAKAIRSDINSQIEKKGSPELNSRYKEADKNYAENFSQFLDSDVYKLTRPDANAETIINDIIKPGKRSDKYTRIEKIQNILPENQRNILGEAWLRNSLEKTGALNPKEFARLIDSLGVRQFKALFPDAKFREKLIDYGKLRGMNESALSRMANPKTGASLGLTQLIGMQGGGVGAFLLSGNLPLAAILGVGPQVGSNILNKIFTSPKLRERFVEKMLKNSKNASKEKPKLTGLPALTSADKEKKRQRQTVVVDLKYKKNPAKKSGKE